MILGVRDRRCDLTLVWRPCTALHEFKN